VQSAVDIPAPGALLIREAKTLVNLVVLPPGDKPQPTKPNSSKQEAFCLFVLVRMYSSVRLYSSKVATTSSLIAPNFVQEFRSHSKFVTNDNAMEIIFYGQWQAACKALRHSSSTQRNWNFQGLTN
jgi:hypothetical protein